MRKNSRPKPRAFPLKVRKRPYRRLIEFPRVKGRTVEKVQFFTTTNAHSITISFQDETALVLSIDPGFTLRASFDSRKGDPLRVLNQWPEIVSE